MAVVDRARFTIRDAALFLLVIAVTVVGIRAEHERNIQTHDNERAATLVAIAVCQQSNVLIEASMAKKSPAEQRLARPIITQYLSPLDKALEALGQPKCEDS